MRIIGLTGPTGSGKSTVALIASDLGFGVVDCDKIAREVVENNRDVLDRLCKAFGDDIFNANGGLDRKALAVKAFSSAENTETLNSITLPAIADAVLDKIKKLEAEKRQGILLDAPTLYESGLDKVCDSVIAVLADSADRRRRIILRDGLTDEQADARLSASKPDGFYTERTGHIIYNTAGYERFRGEVKHMLERLAV